MIFSERLNECLSLRGLKPATLAHRCGVSRTTVKYWLDGTTKDPKTEHLIKLAEVFGVNAEWLRTGAGERYKASQLEASQNASAYVVQHLPEKIRDMVRWLEDLPPNINEAVYQFVKALNDAK